MQRFGEARLARRWIWVALFGVAVAGPFACAEDAPQDPVDVGTSAVDQAADVAFDRAAIIPISGEISDVTAESITRRIAEARAAGVKLIVFEINTPGGMVTSALDICAAIKNLVDIKTVAWVNVDAYSAGSMISVACDEIVMARGSTIGDCGVILGGPTGPAEVPEELRAKAESPVIEQFRHSAALNGYDQLLCESLVVKERVVYWIEHIETGERRFVNELQKKKLVGTSDVDTSGFAEAGAEPSPAYTWRLVKSYVDVSTRNDASVPVFQPVVPETELLTMAVGKAVAFGFCKAVVPDEEGLRARYNVTGEFLRIDSNWSENFTGWLTSMPVRMFLLVIILLGAYVEFNTPGVGVPGLVALICLGVFVGAPYLTGLANAWEIVIIFIGFALLAVEIFVIPGFGVAGLGGIVCILVGLLATFIPEEPNRTFPLYWPQLEQGLRGLEAGLIVLASSGAAAVVAMIIFSRMMPKLTWLHGVIPPNPEPVAVVTADPYHGYARVGDVGVVESPLRPAGKARFGDQLVDVVTEGDLLEPPTEVRVVEHSGNRIVVRRIV